MAGSSAYHELKLDEIKSLKVVGELEGASPTTYVDPSKVHKIMGRHKKPTSLGLTQGLQRDVDGLLARFINSQSVRYEEFSRIWRELNFPLIFCGLKNSTTERTFAGEVFFIALKYLLPPTDLQRKIFGMYLLYGIYYTQPCKPPMKIRVTKEHWDALLELYRELQKAEHLDAAYIFLKMRRNQIFHFVVHTKPMLYTRTYRDDAYDKWKSGKEILTATFHDDLLEQLHTIHSQYQEMKQNLGLNNNLSMKLVRDSMADYIVKRVHSHLLSDEEEEESEVEPEANPVQERAARIATLKSKSFSTPGQASRSQRHLGQASASSETEEPTQAEQGRKRKKKKGRGRKPGVKELPPSELDKKKAWSILPRKRLQDVEEEKEETEKEADDEASDEERRRKKRPRKAAAKTSTKQSKNKKGKQKSKKKNSMKGKTQDSTNETESVDERKDSEQSDSVTPEGLRRLSSRRRRASDEKEDSSNVTEAQTRASKRKQTSGRGRQQSRVRFSETETDGDDTLASSPSWIQSGSDGTGPSPQKRGRGRPRKVQSSESEVGRIIGDAEEIVSQKRGRGRPRKVQSSESEVGRIISDASDQPVPAGSEVQRKTPTDAEEVVSLKRKRGDPGKFSPRKVKWVVSSVMLVISLCPQVLRSKGKYLVMLWKWCFRRENEGDPGKFSPRKVKWVVPPVMLQVLRSKGKHLVMLRKWCLGRESKGDPGKFSPQKVKWVVSSVMLVIDLDPLVLRSKGEFLVMLGKSCLRREGEGGPGNHPGCSYLT
ncbi:uncharacterized protein [Diadema antillarum]|uniref:uncharacterized protein n=1 Tax=Diadema antillarum TaxID=105358 RepID=UPI003A840508